ncbi:MAG TPA: hypothetical protein VM843_06650, partial [Flavisolibacter sp.]|nr:hypothetical protein [Flavisolibacter sp.]
FGKPVFTLAKLSSVDAPWVADSAVTDFVPKGYQLDKSGVPTFRYFLGGAWVEDAVRVSNNGEGVTREISIKDATGNYFARLAEGSAIEEGGNGLYLVDGKSFYLRIEDAGGAKPVIRDGNGSKMLLIPVQQKLRYSIIF